MKKLFLLLILILALTTAPVEAANRMYWANCLTGGGDCLDGIDPTNAVPGSSPTITLAAGDGAFVLVDSGVGSIPNYYVYRLYADGATASSPTVISPATNPGSYRWHLSTFQASSYSSSQADGSNALTITNNTTFSCAASANQLEPIANVWNGCENGSAVGAVVFDTKTQTLTGKSVAPPFVDGHTDATNLTAAQVTGTIIYNTGQTSADVTLNLPAAAAGYNSLLCVGTTVASNKWRVRAASTDKIYLMAADGTITAGSDNGYVGYSTTAKYPVIGQCFAIWTFKTDNYDWLAKPIGNIVLTAE